ncbi:hypothetical protein RHMOL_Rhmol08G0007100 [Rhododendron molle]|uniref:Uncharacterized protein n=1 Tax=Rhododendron molle TaxID=49168 RepID=A0ACC0MK44_RHOML|nr:hypothetical protein RHMOL_Rhmol08G0007100 [Rhododendron molle]
MAFTATVRCPSLFRLPRNSISLPQSPTSIPFRSSPAHLSRPKPLSIRSASVEVLDGSDLEREEGERVVLRGFQSGLLRHHMSTATWYPPAPPASGGLAPAVGLTDNALKHLSKMRSERNDDLCLRIGVKQGGCSGMSYTMEFESRENARPDDSIIEYNGFVIVCDPKSLLFIYGMQLDYSDALIGGGFSFKNPNATQTCGCGKSFAAEM